MSRSIKLRNGDDVAATLGDIQQRIVHCGLPGSHAERFQSALQCGNASLEHIIGRIADSAIAMSLDFEVEERRAMLSTIERISNGLVDRNGHRARGRIDYVAAADGNRIVPHWVHSPIRLPPDPDHVNNGSQTES